MSKNGNQKKSPEKKRQVVGHSSESDSKNSTSSNQSQDLVTKAFKNPLIVKNADGEYAPVGYKKREIRPAEKAELLSVAKAMHQDEYEPRVRKLFATEAQAAEEALRTRLYVSYRLPNQNWDCIRVSSQHKCFCGCLLAAHEKFTGKQNMLRCETAGCKCKRFAFIPSRPEDVGEFWFQRRKNFDVSTYRVKCKCKHAHDQHDPTLFNCRQCGCGAFHSAFLCAACDRHWEEHETFFETERERRDGKMPYGQDFVPFNDHEELSQVMYTADGQIRSPSDPNVLPSNQQQKSLDLRSSNNRK